MPNNVNYFRDTDVVACACRTDKVQQRRDNADSAVI